MKQKKAISPVVATALLIVVAVTAVVGFQNWFSNFESNILANTEQKSLTNSNLKIEGVIGDTLYLKSSGADTISLLKISDSSGNEMCTLDSNSQLEGDTKLLMTFDNNTIDGNIVEDLSGYGNNGTIYGLTYTENNCINGGCFDFDGTNLDFINISKTKSENISKEISVNSWINWRGNTIFNFQRIICSPGEYFCYWINNKNASTGEQSVSIRFTGTNRKEPIYLGQISYNISSIHITNKWVNLLFTYDGEFTYLYLNGNKMPVIYMNNATHYQNYDYYYGNLAVTNTGDFLIGNRYTYNRPFNGTIDEISIYSRALTDEEVKALYKAKKALPYEMILGDGIKSIDISSCNLQKGQKYNVVTFTQNSKAESTIIKK